jgi:hypothetical protein
MKRSANANFSEGIKTSKTGGKTGGNFWYYLKPHDSQQYSSPVGATTFLILFMTTPQSFEKERLKTNH